MITLSKSGSTVTFTFDENSGYLQNGTIDVPVNSLSLITDESDMATFRKSASNDIFISARYEEFGMSKAELEAWYKANMVSSGGGGGGTGGTTPEEVQQMIDESISGKADTSAVTESISAATDDMATQTWVGEQGYITSVDLSNYATLDDVSEATSGKVDTSDFNTYSGTVDTAINSKASESDLSALTDVVSAHTANTDIHVTTADKTAWNAKSDFSGSYNDLTDKLSAGTNITIVDNVISAEGGGGTVDTAITSGSSNAVCSSAIWNAVTYSNNVTIEFDESTHISTNFPSGCTNLQVIMNDTEYGEVRRLDLNDGEGNPYDYIEISAFEGEIYVDDSGSGLFTYTTAYTNNIYETFITWSSTVDVVTLTAFEHEADGTVVAIMNGGWINENTYTKSEVDAALSGKQDTLSAGTNITISGNVISATGGGGGKAIEAGRGITITTGTTADTVSFNLPLSAGTGANSIREGSNTIASGAYSHAEGSSTNASGSDSHTEGDNTIASGWSSHAEGSYTIAGGFYSHAEGNATSAMGIRSHTEGTSTTASGESSHAEGYGTKAINKSEHASGQYNVSSSGSSTFGDSGNTLFSVGNGTANNARHNAFEIRQNGDIYISSGGTDIKLQDHLGGGGGSITIDPSLDSGSTNAVANSAITNAIEAVSGAIPTTTSAVTSGSTAVVESGAVYEQMGGLKLVKLTQSAYDTLSPNYDSNTLYVIVN